MIMLLSELSISEPMNEIECVHFVVFVNDNDKNQHNSLNRFENNRAKL